jgi:hypothetical protein
METKHPEIDGSIALEGGTTNWFQVITTSGKPKTWIQHQVAENTRRCITKWEDCQPDCDGLNCKHWTAFQERVGEILDGVNVGYGANIQKPAIEIKNS